MTEKIRLNKHYDGGEALELLGHGIEVESLDKNGLTYIEVECDHTHYAGLDEIEARALMNFIRRSLKNIPKFKKHKEIVEAGCPHIGAKEFKWSTPKCRLKGTTYCKWIECPKV
jgi:hypothetical protein